MPTPAQIVDTMMHLDYFSQWLGIERVQEGAGSACLRMQVRKEMLNGFGIAHGGITYALADSCLAFAANGHGKKAVSVETSISHTVPVKEGDILTATAQEESCTHRIALYLINIHNQRDEKVALFKGTVYRTDKHWE